MKKILTYALSLGMVFAVHSQENNSAADKKFLAGITLGAAINFNSPQTKTITTKTGGDYMVGMALDWNFTKNVGLSSGLEFEFDNFKTLYEVTGIPSVYYAYDDKDIFRNKDAHSASSEYFLLKERKHNSIYLTIPVMLKFQTNYLGYFRYFGRFGIRNSFLLMTRVSDTGHSTDVVGAFDPSIPVNSMDKMHSKGLMSFYRGSVGLTGGAEYNVTGSTTLVAEIGYFYGFSEMFRQSAKQRSLYNLEEIIADDGTVTYKQEYYAPKLKQGVLMLKFSVLF